LETVSYDSIRFIYDIDTVKSPRGMHCTYGCIFTDSYDLTRSFTDVTTVPFYLVLKPATAYTDTLEWSECNSGQATVGSDVCTVYTSGQPCLPCVLCEISFNMPKIFKRLH